MRALQVDDSGASRPLPGPMMWLALALAFIIATAAAADIDWALTEATCIPNGDEVEILSCGAYGKFVLFDREAPEGCDTKGSGSDDPHSYPPPFEMEQAPSQTPIDPWPVPAPPLTPPPSNRLQRGSDSRAGASRESWIALLDFLGLHSLSAQWLAEETGGRLTADLFYLDSPQLISVLGPEIGDFHLLASLCAVLDEVDIKKRLRPEVLNMSLGRSIGPGENVDSGNCDADTLLCQMSKVIGTLRERGTRVVAAAGNHREPLLPGALHNVAAVGALDVTHFLHTGAVKPSWETPDGVEALFPANGLCLRGGVPAAGGSSFASAIFAGWLAEARLLLPVLDPLDGESWSPQWSEGDGCFVLNSGTSPVTRCNAGFDGILADLTAPSSENCWLTEGATETLVGGPPPPAEPQPAWPSFDEWIAVNHPTPESDPCIPCIDGGILFFGPTDDLLINLSRTTASPHYLHQLYLRVGSDFYPMGLGASAAEVATGAIDYILLPGWQTLIDPNSSASVISIRSENAEDDCSSGGNGSCYWHASQLFRPIE